MAYTLTPARPLLNAAELELFSQSRADAVKQLTAAKLAGAVKRTRTLRDKYRDLYQRQTVAVRTSTPGAVTGDDNERTQRKADILQEVLERYETRATALQEQGNGKTNAKAKAGAKTGTKTGAKGAAKSTAASTTATAASTSSKATGKPAGKAGAAKTSAGKSASAASPVPAAKAGKTVGKTTGKAQSAQTAPSKSADGSAGGASKSSNASPLNTLAGAGAGAKASAGTDAGAGFAASSKNKAGKAPARSPKAPSRKAPTAGNKAAAPHVNAPLDTVPSAKRASPLKQKPANIAVQAHQSSSGRRTQGKRDSR